MKIKLKLRIYIPEIYRYLTGREIREFIVNSVSQEQDDGIDSWNLGYNEKEMVLELWTGVDDKHGKPIFEGDRVRTVTGAVGVVIFRNDNSEFTVDLDNLNAYDFCCVDSTQEVIGNIHDEEGK